jgi:large conductance mechanosensitive channel
VSIFSEFKEFIARGNVVDLAVGVIIGGAFGKIVTGLVSDIVMPPIGMLIGGIDFSQLKIVLKAADPVAKKPEVVIAYGDFVNISLQFLIIAVVIFLIVKGINSLKREPPPADPAAAPAQTPSEALLTEIRDLLVKQQAG